MPIYEYACFNDECDNRWHREEHFLHPSQVDTVFCCESCKQEMKKLLSCPHFIWSKDLVDYGDPSKEFYGEDKKRGGIRVCERKNTPNGAPVWRTLKTHQELVEYCKREGLHLPEEAPANMDISKDGKVLSSQGMPGSWV